MVEGEEVWQPWRTSFYTRSARKSTNYSNKYEIRHYDTPKYYFNVFTLKIKYAEGFLVVKIVQLNVDIFFYAGF